jgi:hypothetical protein
MTTTPLDTLVLARESHRVMRAYFGQYFLSYLGLSCLLTVLLFLTLAPTYSDSGATGYQFTLEPIRLATGVALFVFAAASVLFVLSWLQFVPRQITMLWPAVVGILAGSTNAYAFLSFIGPLQASLEASFGAAIGWLLASVLAGGLAIASLGIGVSWSIDAGRLVWAPRNEFLVARGWRAPRYTLGGAIRRMLGVPTYASSLARSRSTVLLLFLLAGVLGGGAALFPLLAPAWVLRAMAWSAMRIDPYDPASGSVFLASTAGFIIGPMILFAVLAFFGRLVTRAAQRIAANNYQSIRDWDDRAPILYLRSFAIDNRTVRMPPRGLIARLIGLGARFATLDETLLDCAAPYGPVIAIGDPRDPIPPLGAARTFVRGDDWQSVVSDLACAAKLIVLTTDTSEGVKWEVRHILADPELSRKTVFLASPMASDAERGAVLTEIAGALGQAPLPVETIGLFTIPSGGVQALTAPTLSTDSYATAINLRLQREFGLDVDFPRAPHSGGRAVRTGVSVVAVVSAGAAAIAMLAINPGVLSPTPIHVAAASEQPAPPLLDEPAPPTPAAPIEAPVIGSPSADDFTRYFPERALERGEGAHVWLDCVADESGRLDCGNAAEDPPGWGFGAAALQLARRFEVAQNFSDGAPTAGAQFVLFCDFYGRVCALHPKPTDTASSAPMTEIERAREQASEPARAAE